jgi:Ran GTPase-activating protein (RanGAP) involved in mRNA processing and transport
LHFHVGYESLNYLIDAINTGGPLDRLSFSVMGITADHVRRLFAGPVAGAITELRFREEEPLGGDGLHALADVLPTSLRDLELADIRMKADGLESLARCDRLTGLRRLNLSRNPLKPRAARVLSLSRSLAGLRSLDLSKCRIEDKSVRHITQAKFWPNLVELNLRQNPISAAGVKHLLDAPPPQNLTALILDDTIRGADRPALAKKYGDSVIFTPPEVQGL